MESHLRAFGNVVIVFSAMVVPLLWTVLPSSGNIQPYPLSDQIIDSRTYIWIGSIYAAILLLVWSANNLNTSQRYKEFYNAAFILQACQFVEYWINFNEAWVRMHNIPVNIATLSFVILFVYALKSLLWNR